MPYKLLHKERKYLSELKQFINEKETEKIKVKNPGMLEVPEGKDVETLGADHFKNLIKKKGWNEISKALMNLVRWNKNENPKLSSWADNMQEKLSKWVENKRESNENFGD